jgi:hypothetical protein
MKPGPDPLFFKGAAWGLVFSALLWGAFVLLVFYV